MGGKVKNMTSKTIAWLLALLCVSANVYAQQVPLPINVCVSAPIRDGFVDTTKEIQDSIKDIKGALEKRSIWVVDRCEGARMRLTVFAKGVVSDRIATETQMRQRFANIIIDQGIPGAANTYWLSTVLEVESYGKEFAGFSTGTPHWKDCAEQIADHVKAWIEANTEQLRNPNPSLPKRDPRNPSPLFREALGYAASPRLGEL
jgi:hypothetical protein